MSAKKQTKPKSEQPASITYKSIRYYFQLFDGLWSIPIAFALFIIAGTLSAEYFGDALISTEYVQYIVLASFIMVFANFVTFLGIRFNFRALQNAVYDREIKYELSTYLTTWQKVVLYLLLYAFYFAAFLFILRMLMTATA
jgi:hypothetical protein